MKQRLLFMNGQCLVQSEQEGQWNVDKVEKAGSVKPGVYNIYLSSQADKSKDNDGVIVYTDKNYVYQKVGKTFITHRLEDFDNLPTIGQNSNIRYENGKAIATAATLKLSRQIT